MKKKVLSLLLTLVLLLGTLPTIALAQEEPAAVSRLDALEVSVKSGGADIRALSPEFSPEITSYDITVPDTSANIYVRATKAVGTDKLTYRNYPYATGSSGSTLTSGSWSNGLSTAINSTANRNKLSIYVGQGSFGSGESDTEYTLIFHRQLSLKVLTVTEASTAFNPAFNAEILNYTVGVPADTETVHINPTPSAAAYDIEVNGEALAKGASAEITPAWDASGQAEVTIDVGYTVNETIGNYDINAIPTQYTLTLVKEGASEAPIILTTPKGAKYLDTVSADKVAPIEVKATASGGVSYQWYSNTENSYEGASAIPDAAADSYTPAVGHVDETLTTYYFCEIKANGHTVKTDVVCVTVMPDPTPYDVVLTRADGSPLAEEPYTFALGAEGITLTVDAKSRVPGGAWSYKWWHRTGLEGTGGGSSGTDINKTFTIVTNRDSLRRYDCVVTYTVDGVGYSATSPQTPPIYVLAASAQKPSITRQPQNAEYVVNAASVTNLSVTASVTDGGALSYQWYSSADKAIFTAIPGATSASYKPDVLTEPGAVYYYCAVKSTIASVNGDTYISLPIFSDIAEIKYRAINFSEWEGEGTADEPLLIKNQADLVKLRDLVNGGTDLSGYYVKMTADITLPSGWVPFGTLKPGATTTGSGVNIWPFSGSFDGGGYTLTVPSGGLPLFGYVRGASVRNLKIYGAKIAGYGLVNNYTVDYGHTGNYNNYIANGYPVTIAIDNVTIKSGTTTLNAGFIGGYASGANIVNITNCTAESGVTIGYDKKQSAVGTFAGNLSGAMDNCVSYADVYGTSSVGGLVGGKGEAMGPCVIKNSVFGGTLTATGSHVGGICGRGYASSSAPNAPLVTIQNCYVTGDVTGADHVGGIFGGEPAVYQAWANGVGYIQNNFFVGSVAATGGTYVGGVIGYMKSLDRHNVIENNYYLDTGASKGIGFAHIIDTDSASRYANEAIRYVNTKSSGSITIDGISFNKDNNRSDDPMGAHSDRLAKAAAAGQFADGTVMDALAAGSNRRSWAQGDTHPIFSDIPFITDITASGYLSPYYLGESFTTAGLALTVKYSDGTTQPITDVSAISLKGFDSKSVGIKTISGEYEGRTFSFDVIVVSGSRNQNPEDQTIKVFFALYGDSVHTPTDEGGPVHTMREGNLIEWIPMQSVTVSNMATVLDVFDKMLKGKGTYENQTGNYISSITFNGVTLAEFTNGPDSGWMYTLNGAHPTYGVAQQYLVGGDRIIFHYTDDYTKEEGSEKWNSPGTGGTFSGSTTLTPKVTAKDGAAAAGVSSAEMSKAIEEAKKNDSGAITVEPQISGKAAKVSVEIPKSALTAMGSDTDADLKIVTPGASVTIPNNALASVASKAEGGTVTVVVEAVETEALTAGQQKAVGNNPVFDISILSGGKKIGSFGGKSITISLPYTLKTGESAEGVTVWYLSDEGKLERLSCKYDKSTGLATFTTTHLSSFVVGYEAWTNPFTDVKSGDWFYDAVKYAVHNELFNGTSAATFSPNADMTRAMLVTVLYRLEGEPGMSGTKNPFADVKAGQWYADAVLWASAGGIVTGYGSGLFGINDPITREQMAVMLLRYAQFKKYDTARANDLSAFTDAGGTASYALAAMKWANAEGLITGRTATTLAPSGTATRAEVAAILMRFAQGLAK